MAATGPIVPKSSPSQAPPAPKTPSSAAASSRRSARPTQVIAQRLGTSNTPRMPPPTGTLPSSANNYMLSVPPTFPPGSYSSPLINSSFPLIPPMLPPLEMNPMATLMMPQMGAMQSQMASMDALMKSTVEMLTKQSADYLQNLTTIVAEHKADLVRMTTERVQESERISKEYMEMMMKMTKEKEEKMMKSHEESRQMMKQMNDESGERYMKIIETLMGAKRKDRPTTSSRPVATEDSDDEYPERAVPRKKAKRPPTTTQVPVSRRCSENRPIKESKKTVKSGK